MAGRAQSKAKNIATIQLLLCDWTLVVSVTVMSLSGLDLLSFILVHHNYSQPLLSVFMKCVYNCMLMTKSVNWEMKSVIMPIVAFPFPVVCLLFYNNKK